MPTHPQQKIPHILYIVYWGILDGTRDQQAVLPPVLKLARSGASISLMTFEKPAHLADNSERKKVRQILRQHGVRWIPLRYHKRPTAPATAFDALQGVLRGVATHMKCKPDIVHARTIVGGLVGLSLAPLLRAKLIYHNEGFYPDEQVDGGLWQAGSLQHRVAHNLEQKMFARADGIIALSHRAKNEIENFPEVARRSTPVRVVPSIVDLNHFPASSSNTIPAPNALRFVSLGGVGGRYQLDKIGRFVAVAREELGGGSLRVLTYVGKDEVEEMLTDSGLSELEYSVDCVPHARVPNELSQCDVGMFFLKRGISEHACSPTKIGEYWASGLPVVVSPNTSDTDEIIRREKVGVIVAEHSDSEYRRAARELKELLADPELSLRCRRASEKNYSLERGVETQLELYRRVLAMD